MTLAKNSKTELLRTIGSLRSEIKTLRNKKQTKKNKDLYRIGWLLSKTVTPSTRKKNFATSQYYGDLTKLNTSRLILDSVGKDILTDIVNDYLDFLGTSAAIYEKNGDYALGIFSSGWCRLMDETSRKLCKTSDNSKALRSGRWHCHESCWGETSKISIKTGRPVDIECKGGIHLYAVPIRSGREIVGAINFGYGDPPKNLKKLKEIARKYDIPVKRLLKQSDAYESRPPFLVSVAKKRLLTASKLIGEIVERKRVEKTLDTAITNLNERIKELNCLYSLSKLTENLDVLNINELAKKLPSIIRFSLQNPDYTCTKILIDGKEFKTPNCRNVQCTNLTDITVEGLKRGHISIGYLKPRPKLPKKHFLKEEQEMLNTIAEQLSKAINYIENKEKIREALSIKSDFISTVSHELRTPLTAIKESLSIILNENLKNFSPSQKQFLNIAQKNVNRLARLINDVLDFQKMETSKTKLSFQKNNINSVARDVYQTLNPLAKEKKLNLILKTEKKLPSSQFNKDKITQVLLNIVNNSVKFTTTGNITIKTAKKNSNALHISVKDTGPGIKKKDLPKIFHSFEQIGKGSKRKAGGTGLGLAISKELIQKHNGKIWAESKFGKSTTVHFLLPIKERRQPN